MNILLKFLAAGALLALGYSGTALAQPDSSCGTAANSVGTGNHIECDLFEFDQGTPTFDLQGNPTEIGPRIQLPQPVGIGAALILEPNGNPADQTTWSDELIFTDVQDVFFVQLVSNGCNSGNEGDVSCFVAFDHFIFEDANGFAVDGPQFGPAANIYRVFSDGEVPEPTSLLLLGAAFAGIGFARRGRKLH
jgi:hypothetical protein